MLSTFSFFLCFFFKVGIYYSYFPRGNHTASRFLKEGACNYFSKLVFMHLNK